MKQCMRITFIIGGEKKKLHAFMQDFAEKLQLEGAIQSLSDTKVRVVVCGSKDNVEEFVDAVHIGIAQKKLESLEIEPFLKDRDYRGVFRVIE